MFSRFICIAALVSTAGCDALMVGMVTTPSQREQLRESAAFRATQTSAPAFPLPGDIRTLTVSFFRPQYPRAYTETDILEHQVRLEDRVAIEKIFSHLETARATSRKSFEEKWYPLSDTDRTTGSDIELSIRLADGRDQKIYFSNVYPDWPNHVHLMNLGIRMYPAKKWTSLHRAGGELVTYLHSLIPPKPGTPGPGKI